MNKKILALVILLSLCLLGKAVSAEETVMLNISDNGHFIFSSPIPLPAEGTSDVSDTHGNTHGVNARSVLSVVSAADAEDSSFRISDLMYYSSFDAFYLKCIELVNDGERCDNWQYKVNDADPGMGMDQAVLSGGENISLYFQTEPASTPTPSIPGLSGGGSGGSPAVMPEPEVVPMLIPTTPPVVTDNTLPSTAPLAIEVKIEKPAQVKPRKIALKKNTEIKLEATAIESLPKTVESKKESKFWSFVKWVFGF